MADTGFKSIKHGTWNFEYSKTNIFSSDVDSFTNNQFIQANDTSILGKEGFLSNSDLNDFRRASSIHKIARNKARMLLYNGSKIADLVDTVENLIIKLCQQDTATYFLKGSSSGIAFPVGVNINNIVAHDSKYQQFNNISDERVFFTGDVVKIDIGVHINGRIIDSAFTHIVTDTPGVHDAENIYNSVLDASRESMFTAIKMAGPDQRLIEISESIDEIIQSYEVNISSKEADGIPIKSVEGIGGHNIKQYRIHGGKLILSRPDPDIQGDQRMEEDEIYAIETYATTGYGTMTQNENNNHYTHFMEHPHEEIEADKSITKNDKRFYRQTELYSWIKTRNGLPFSSAWIPKSVTRVEKALKLGIPSGQLVVYPPLMDEKNSVVAQFEHTIHVNDRSVEIFSLGEDY